MAERIPHFPFYPADFMHGVRGLSAQDVGVYTMLLCRIYEADGPVEWHALRLATYCGMRRATFEKTVARLVDLGKLSIENGMLTNARAMIEISSRANKLKNNSKAGKASAEKRQQNQHINSTDVQRTLNHTDTDTDTDKDKEGGGGGSARGAEKPDPKPGEPTFRERLLTAIGADPVSGMIGPNGRTLGTKTDMIEAGRWLTDLGLTEAECLVQAAETISTKRDGPPSKFSYFTPAMTRLAGAKSAPPLESQTPATTQPPTPRRQLWAVDLSKFNDDGSIKA